MDRSPRHAKAWTPSPDHLPRHGRRKPRFSAAGRKSGTTTRSPHPPLGSPATPPSGRAGQGGTQASPKAASPRVLAHSPQHASDRQPTPPTNNDNVQGLESASTPTDHDQHGRRAHGHHHHHHNHNHHRHRRDRRDRRDRGPPAEPVEPDMEEVLRARVVELNAIGMTALGEGDHTRARHALAKAETLGAFVCGRVSCGCLSVTRSDDCLFLAQSR